MMVIVKNFFLKNKFIYFYVIYYNIINSLYIYIYLNINLFFLNLIFKIIIK